jgi:hypothetical protein
MDKSKQLENKKQNLKSNKNKKYHEKENNINCKHSVWVDVYQLRTE